MLSITLASQNSVSHASTHHLYFVDVPWGCIASLGNYLASGCLLLLYGYHRVDLAFTIKVPQSKCPHSLGLPGGAPTENTHHVDELLKGQLPATILAEQVHYACAEGVASELVNSCCLLLKDTHDASMCFVTTQMPVALLFANS